MNMVVVVVTVGAGLAAEGILGTTLVVEYFME